MLVKKFKSRSSATNTDQYIPVMADHLVVKRGFRAILNPRLSRERPCYPCWHYRKPLTFPLKAQLACLPIRFTCHSVFQSQFMSLIQIKKLLSDAFHGARRPGEIITSFSIHLPVSGLPQSALESFCLRQCLCFLRPCLAVLCQSTLLQQC